MPLGCREGRPAPSPRLVRKPAMVTARRERQTGQSASCWRWAARLPDRDAPARHAWATGQLTSARLTTPTSSRSTSRGTERASCSTCRRRSGRDWRWRGASPRRKKCRRGRASSGDQARRAEGRPPPRKAQEYRHWAPRPRSPAPETADGSPFRLPPHRAPAVPPPMHRLHLRRPPRT